MRKPPRPRLSKPMGPSPGGSPKGSSGGSSNGARERKYPPRMVPPATLAARPYRRGLGAKGRTGQVQEPGRPAVAPPAWPAGADRRHDRPANDRDLVFGVEPIRELIAAVPATVRVLYLKAGLEGRFAAEAAAIRQHGGRVAVASDDELAQLAGTAARHQGIVASIREYRYATLEDVIGRGADPVVIIDGVTDPRNLGAILRSAECAGARAIVIAKNRTAGITPAAIKASSGSWIHLTIAQCGNVVQALEALKAAGYWIAALAPGGETSIYHLDTGRKLAIVLGSEDCGVRDLVRKHADFIVNIPMRGRVGSLNVSVAAAVALFEIARRRADQN
jgi:23S rRNA (guanosine2251-2'-O)-methyltransferase